MDRSIGTVASPRIQDVTNQILKTVKIYGSSDNTMPGYASANMTLNYHEGGSINRPELNRVGIIPFKLTYQDSVGLFGKENHFVRVNLSIDKDKAYKCYEEPGWECAVITEASVKDPYYDEAAIDDSDHQIVNTYEPADIIGNRLPNLVGAYVSIHLKNLKTGNQYIDSWLDMRLYTKAREEHPFDEMYCGVNDYFYIGFHARNTKRLPYNIECTVGDSYVAYKDMTEDQRKLIANVN